MLMTKHELMTKPRECGGATRVERDRIALHMFRHSTFGFPSAFDIRISSLLP